MGNSYSSGTVTPNGASSNMSAEREFIDKEIASRDVVIFSKTYCGTWLFVELVRQSADHLYVHTTHFLPGYCSSTKSLFARSDLTKDVAIHELDRMSNGSSIQRALVEMTGQTTVPNVFVKGQHIGGNDDTQAAFRSGKLNSMLRANKL